MLLLDTNVLSELTAARRDENVVSWFRGQDPGALRLSVVSVGELRFGVERLPLGAKRIKLQRTLDDWIIEFNRRILPFDLETALVWGKLLRQAGKKQRSLPRVDAMLAATAEVHGLTLVTRNVRDFEGWGGPVLNPWEPQPSTP
jgi:predicted nucleic acid-binding protein